MSCQALGDQRVSPMFSSLTVLRPLLPEPCRRVCADPYVGKGRIELLLPFLWGIFRSFEVVWVLPCVFFEAWQFWKSNNYSLLSETLDKKVLHEVAHPFCGVSFNQQHISLPPGTGIRCRRWGLQSSRHAPQLAPYSSLLTAWLSWQPPESLPTPVLLRSKQTLAV